MLCNETGKTIFKFSKKILANIFAIIVSEYLFIEVEFQNSS